MAILTATDEEIVERVRSGETPLFEILMRRYNRRLYRIARSICGEDAAADVVQNAYLHAFEHLSSFTGAARFSTWLTKIGIHGALAEKRARDRLAEGRRDVEAASRAAPPDAQLADAETRRCLERAVDALPEAHRLVFVLRDIEGLSTEETAAATGLSAENVKVRLHRAHVLLREELRRDVGDVREAFGFGGVQCDAIVSCVIAALEHGRNASARARIMKDRIGP